MKTLIGRTVLIIDCNHPYFGEEGYVQWAKDMIVDLWFNFDGRSEKFNLTQIEVL